MIERRLADNNGAAYSDESLMKLSGCATLNGTAGYRDRFAANAARGQFRKAQRLWFSSIGIGTYLGNADAETDRSYREAIARAVELGVNVIDTAANYRFQRSERAIGFALADLVQRGFRRDEIIICTKGGYVPFDGLPPQDLRRYLEDTFVQPGIASFADIVGGAHCMTPKYLQHQLEQSLRNMAIECIDVYYIHNPESQLTSIALTELWRRLRLAFQFLEESVAAGKIKNYGVATWNGFRAEPDAGDYHGLARMVELAHEVAGDDHHFRFIQLPVNLAMPEALFFQNQELREEYVSSLEAADNLGLSVIASGSIMQGQVARGLPESIREALGSLATDAQTGIQFVRSVPGVTTALVGMSQLAHVEENLQLISVPPATSEDLLRVFDQE